MRSLRQRLHKWFLTRFLHRVRRGLERDPTPARVRRDMASFDRYMAGKVPLLASDPVDLGDCEAVWIDALAGDAGRVILYLHGGAFVGEAHHTHQALLAKLCRRAAARGLYVVYRLAPEHPYPAAADDCLSAYRHLLGLGLEAGRIVIVGDSAGGNLALSTAMRLRDLGEPLPAALVLLSPALDATLSGDSMHRNDGQDPMFRRVSLERLAEGYVTREQCLDPYVSPLFGSVDGLPPTLVLVGSSELLLDDALRWAARARDVTVQVWHDMPHVWPALHGLAESEQAVAVAGDFIVRHTPAPAITRPAAPAG